MKTKATVYGLAQRALDERGYLVIASDLELNIGEVLDYESNSSFGHFSSKLVVLSKTDEGDMHAQDKLLRMPYAYNDHYYRTVAE